LGVKNDIRALISLLNCWLAPTNALPKETTDNMQIGITMPDFHHLRRPATPRLREAHKRGLAIGQKNAPDQTRDLVQIYDFAITEDAFYYDWAKDMLPYIQAGKPVFAAEYTDLPGNFQEFCRRSKELGFITILKHRDLDAWLKTCP
jgi:hypothetical protein